MKLRILILAFAALVLAIPAQAQSLRYLAYNTTNWTVAGWTNTNALTFTNAVRIGTSPIPTNAGIMYFQPTGFVFAPVASFVFTNVVEVAELAVSSNGITFQDDGDRITRTNLFGHGGITTNISVLVPGGTNTLRFTNGILFSNSVP